MSLESYSSHGNLEKLAKKPYDLTAKGALSVERLKEFSFEIPGLSLFYGTERVNQEVMKELYAMAEEANVHQKMKDMQSGKVINTVKGCESEDRMVLHTAMRDIFDDVQSSGPASEAAKEMAQELSRLETFVNDHKSKFKYIISVGIGGSYLGPEAIYIAMRHLSLKQSQHEVELFFMPNIDPDECARILPQVDLSETLVVIMSKSGGTLETLTNETFIKQKLIDAGLNPVHHMIAITGKGSPLDDKSKYLASFYMKDYVGGRYSVSSMIGCVLLAFTLGMDALKEFLKGMHDMDKHVLEKDNIALLAALLQIWNRDYLGYDTRAVIPYSCALDRFSAHLQQLIMESNGKGTDLDGKITNDKTCSVIFGEPGTNGQHSFFQMIHQGRTIVPVDFIGFYQSQFGDDIKVKGSTNQEKLLSNMFAQSVALATGLKNTESPNKNFEGNRPTNMLLGKQLTPYVLGQILSLYEHRTAFEGFILGINSFDQEGVQLGKKLAIDCINEFQRAHKRSDPPKSENSDQFQFYIQQIMNIS